jgi:hypothetical protein
MMASYWRFNEPFTTEDTMDTKEDPIMISVSLVSFVVARARVVA